MLFSGWVKFVIERDRNSEPEVRRELAASGNSWTSDVQLTVSFLSLKEDSAVNARVSPAADICSPAWPKSVGPVQGGFTGAT